MRLAARIVPPLRAHPIAAGYVLLPLVALPALLALRELVPDWAPLIWMLYLGPIGLAAAVLAVLAPALSAQLWSGPVVVVLLAVTALAAVNAVLVLRARAAEPPARLPDRTDRFVGSALFLFAGFVFLQVCSLDVVVFLDARGFGGAVSDAIAFPHEAPAVVDWLIALVVTLVGLGAWPLLWLSRRRLVPTAATDLVLQTVLGLVALWLLLHPS